jgi:hypothetical protein
MWLTINHLPHPETHWKNFKPYIVWFRQNWPHASTAMIGIPAKNPRSMQAERAKFRLVPLPPEMDREFRELWNKSVAFADFVGPLYLGDVAAALAHRAPAQKDAILKTLSRCFEPWPSWVLNVAAEILKVYFPTMERTWLRRSLQCLHALFFELRLDGTTPPGTIPVPELDPTVLGAIWGHTIAVGEDCHKRMLQMANNKLVTAEELLKFEEKLEPPKYAADVFAYYVKVRGVRNFGKVADAMAKAKDRTFDKQGCAKETTATEIYRQIFINWPHVETLAGPTELFRFLEPVLDGSRNDPVLRLDRVKKICTRMEIVFGSPIKGQPDPPALSLPAST